MDGSGMYPEGFHPVRRHLDPSAKIEVVGMTRVMAKPKYYIVDFRGPVWFPADMPVALRTGPTACAGDVTGYAATLLGGRQLSRAR